MRVAIIGGTGFVGSYIVDALMSAGHDVSLLCREGSESKLPRDDLFRTVTGDVSSTDALDAVVEGCDAAIYCIGIMREFPRRGVTFEGLQYQGVVRTVAAAKQAGAARFLLMSANGVKVPGTPYQETKKRADDHLLSSGLVATIFRPSVIFGDPRGKMEFATQLYQQMVAPPLPAAGFFKGFNPGEGQILMSPVYVEDVAQAFAVSLTRTGAAGQIHELGGPEAISWSEMIRRIAKATGREKLIVPVPIAAMKMAAMVLDRVPQFPVTRDQLTMLEEDNVADSDTIRALIERAPLPFTAQNLDYLEKS